MTTLSEWLFYVSHLIRQGRFVMPWPAEARYAPVATEDLGRLIILLLFGKRCVA
jgi:NAD(P)H dehydrogenase (quinone)